MIIRCEVFSKDDNGKYILRNELEYTYKRFLADYCNFCERKMDGERGLRIVKYYNYYDVMNIDVYFSNGFKYSYYKVPCKTGASVDVHKLIMEE